MRIVNRIDKLELVGKWISGSSFSEEEFELLSNVIRNTVRYKSFKVPSIGKMQFEYMNNEGNNTRISLSRSATSMLKVELKLRLNLNVMLRESMLSTPEDGNTDKFIANNALPSALIKASDPKTLLQKQLELLEGSITEANSLLNSILSESGYCNIGTDLAHNYPQLRFHIFAIELCHDLVATNASRTTERLGEKLKTIGLDFSKSTYGANQTFSSTYQGNRIGYTAKLYKGETLKVYEKSDDQVRLEIKVGGKRVRSLGCTNSFTCASDPIFQHIFSTLSFHFNKRFEMILNYRCEMYGKDNNHIVAFMEISKKSKSAAHTISIITALINRGRVCSDPEIGYLVRHLHKVGILEKVRKGLYRSKSINFNALVPIISSPRLTRVVTRTSTTQSNQIGLF